MLAVAEWVASLGGAAAGVPSGPATGLGLLALGGLFLVLWIGRGRWAGLAPIGLGLALWAARRAARARRRGPALRLPHAGGPRAQLREGRRLRRRRAGWRTTATPPGRRPPPPGRSTRPARPGEADIPGFGIVRLRRLPRRQKRAEGLAGRRRAVAPNWRSPPAGSCLFLGSERLAREGALAITPGRDGVPVIEGARSRNTARPWTRDPGAG